jgi:hypothetical protein
MASRASVAKSRVPHRASRSNHAAGAPGTVTASGPNTGIWFVPARAATSSGVAAAGERPDPRYPVGAPSHTRLKRSPPNPHRYGVTTPSVRFVAMAASSAFPPSASTARPLAVAR